MADDKGCSGLFAALQAYDRSKLKKTETSVTTVDGRRLLEKVDNHGRRTSHLVSQGILGYVGDVREDLQVAEVLPGLIMGGYMKVINTVSRYYIIMSYRKHDGLVSDMMGWNQSEISSAISRSSTNDCADVLIDYGHVVNISDRLSVA